MCLQVVAELDVVLRELVADVPFVTEETLRSRYRQLCGKELKVSTRPNWKVPGVTITKKKT